MKRLVIIMLLAMPVSKVWAQGCSDAGFCTIGAMQSSQANAADKDNHNSIALSYGFGGGDVDAFIMTPQLEVTKAVGKKGSLEARLPFYTASGSIGNSSGIGDLIVNYTHSLGSSSLLSFKGTIGARVGLGNANAVDKGLPLPMPYQSNLGSTDLILGVSAAWKNKVSASVAYQQPLVQYNENGYLPGVLVNTDATYDDYPPSRMLNRKSDVLLRVDYHFRIKKLGFAAGPLFIYHLGKDEVTLLNGTVANVTGSDGLTLNATASVFYSTSKWKADIAAGTPFVVRDVRPDGLTRAWVVTPRFTWYWGK
jgi:hypothetical protein